MEARPCLNASLCLVQKPGGIVPGPSQLVLHQTNQVFIDSSRESRGADARLAAREISAAAAVGAVAGMRAAVTDEAQVGPDIVAETVVAATAAAESASVEKAVVVTVASTATEQPAADVAAPPPEVRTARMCNPKIPARIIRPAPNPCEWWGAMHQKYVEQIQVRAVVTYGPVSSNVSSLLTGPHYLMVDLCPQRVEHILGSVTSLGMSDCLRRLGRAGGRSRRRL